MLVAFLVNLIQNAPKMTRRLPNDYWYELDDQENINLWREAIVSGGNTVCFIEGNLELPGKLQKIRPDICFNTCEGYGGDSREAHIPVLLEMLKIPYTGAKPLGMTITLNKAITKSILSFHGLPIPKFQVFLSGNEELDGVLQFPLFIKPCNEGTGKGIGIESIVNSEKEMRRRIKYLIKNYNQPILVEEYIQGREITVGIVGNLVNPFISFDIDQLAAERNIHIFPILEVDFSGYPADIGGVFSSKAKIDFADCFRYKCPSDLDQEMTRELQRIAVEAFRITHCLDFCRVDIKIDCNTGNPYIIEVNALPGLTTHSDLTTMAISEGWDFSKLINRILASAIKRYGF